jgi:hemin uptake protein HemP
MTQDPPTTPNSQQAAGSSREATRCVRSEELLQGQRELMIAHGQEMYRLRLTRSGKLILGK